MFSRSIPIYEHDEPVDSENHSLSFNVSRCIRPCLVLDIATIINMSCVQFSCNDPQVSASEQPVSSVLLVCFWFGMQNTFADENFVQFTPTLTKMLKISL